VGPSNHALGGGPDPTQGNGHFLKGAGRLLGCGLASEFLDHLLLMHAQV